MEEDERRLPEGSGDGGWRIDDRTQATFARHLERGDSMIFLVPANLVTDPERGNVGLTALRNSFSCGFGCTKIISRARGDKSQVLVYNERVPEREQDLVLFGVSAARRFGQREAFFIDHNGIGYMISSSEESGRPLGEEYLSDGTDPVAKPAKVTVEGIMKHVETLLGERFSVASDSLGSEQSDFEYSMDSKRMNIKKYGFDCLDCMCPGLFMYWRDFPTDTTRGRISCDLARHVIMAVVIPKNVIRDKDARYDRFEDFTLDTAFGYRNVYGKRGSKKKAMVLFEAPNWSDDRLFLYYAVSAGRIFGQSDILYVDSRGYARKVSCEQRDDLEVGDQTPVFTDANGGERKVTADEFISILEDVAGKGFRKSKGETRSFNCISGMRVGSILRDLDKLKYDALAHCKKPIVRSED